ncbi:hypothetical protein BACPEC_01068 [[Bacteroides] pectinophilus ATCC 43243]|uniref:Uncharacterized protein n=1 Tax=[Bacteroides] pectinophilus ATCC 43243 TaxID=483218 RepID=B7AQW1_9FIRM|nr:hypothetical protein BACPEC_01068 [[Bacteroides] pectinophilus ATCC 43243]
MNIYNCIMQIHIFYIYRYYFNFDKTLLNHSKHKLFFYILLPLYFTAVA